MKVGTILVSIGLPIVGAFLTIVWFLVRQDERIAALEFAGSNSFVRAEYCSAVRVRRPANRCPKSPTGGMRRSGKAGS